MEITVERICEFCQGTFHVIPSRLKHGRGKTCSRKCQYALIKSRISDKQQFNTCLCCGETFRINKKHVQATPRKGVGKYCSRQCRDEHRVGIHHPQYINGSASDRRGPNWQSQKRRTRQRDGYTCQDCGKPKSYDVHHIIPFRKFGIDKYRKANQLSNLVTLCRKCHRIRDIAIQKADRNNNVIYPFPKTP